MMFPVPVDLTVVRLQAGWQVRFPAGAFFFFCSFCQRVIPIPVPLPISFRSDLLFKTFPNTCITQYFHSKHVQIYRPYFPRSRKYRRLFSEPTYWLRRSRGQYGEESNQAGIFKAEGNKSLIPGRLARSLPSLHSKSAKRKFFVCA